MSLELLGFIVEVGVPILGAIIGVGIGELIELVKGRRPLQWQAERMASYIFDGSIKWEREFCYLEECK